MLFWHRGNSTIRVRIRTHIQKSSEEFWWNLKKAKHCPSNQWPIDLILVLIRSVICSWIWIQEFSKGFIFIFAIPKISYTDRRWHNTAASWVKKKFGAKPGSCNFPADSCRFPQKNDMDAQKLKFSLNFSPNGGFPAPNIVFLVENFPTAQNLGAWGNWGRQLPVCVIPSAGWSITQS